MISVEQAQSLLFQLVAPLENEPVNLADAGGRVLAAPVISTITQPPFAASAMDGYAVKNADVKTGARLRVIGEAAAGHGFDGSLSSGETARIFTGAIVPEGADRIIIQEDVLRDGDHIIIGKNLDPAAYIRPAGTDFQQGAEITAPRILTPADIALVAAMGQAQIVASRKPIVALVATGDELVMPGGALKSGQIMASNSFGLKAMFEAAGATCRMLPIARDSLASLKTVFELCAGADLIVTLGGASVGDHDLVAQAASDMGMQRAFYKVAMRPGKPLMAGRLRGIPLIGLPGNPVSSMVCGTIFVLPMIAAMQGLPAKAAPLHKAKLAVDMPQNGPRDHYMRAKYDAELGEITAFDRQDSALLSVLAGANALLLRPANEGAALAGSTVNFLHI